MRKASALRAYLLVAAATSFGACGFAPQPKSGTVACKPTGAACCPEGYLCVGRGASTAGGPSAGTCWSKRDLPPAALAAAHDHTPTVPNDPACLVTDWLPLVPGTGGAPGQLDGGAADAAWLPPTGTGGTVTIGKPDSGADAPLGQDTASDVRLSGTGGSGGPADAPVVDGSDTAADVASEGWLPVPLVDAADAPTTPTIDGASTDTPLPPVDDAASISLDGGAVDGASQEASASLDAADDLVTGGEAGGVDTSPGIEGIVTSIGAGTFFTCAVVHGGVSCWGNNDHGQLGDGTTTFRSAPRPVPGLESGATVVSAGFTHSCAVVNGGLKCWGENRYGGLGDDTTTDRQSPVQVVGLEAGVTTVCAGYHHTCAVANAKAWCWGYNDHGQLGDGTAIDRHVPVLVTGLPSQATVVACGTVHSCAVAGGAAFCWGENMGQLGNGGGMDSEVPVQVGAVTSGASDISAGTYLGCVVVNGAAYCWGNNGSGELGNGGDPYKTEYSPVAVFGLSAGVTRISSNDRSQSCAIVNGGLQCWGLGSYGLGDGTIYNATTPVSIFDAGTGIVAFSVGHTHICAATADALMCWGQNAGGMLGDGTTVDKLTPVTIPLP